MTRLRVLRYLHRRVRGEEDGQEGTSMIEIVVAMIIMTICGSIFTGAVITLYHASNQTQAISDSSQQTNQAYQSLDKLVRYASAITTPAKGTGGDWYVELRDTSSGNEICTQLRIDIPTQQLQRRSWNTANLSTLTAWLPMASNVTNGAAAAGLTQPFVLQTANATTNQTSIHQVLTFNLVARSGPPSSLESSTSAFTLTALNSSTTSDGTPVCAQEGRP